MQLSEALKIILISDRNSLLLESATAGFLNNRTHVYQHGSKILDVSSRYF